MDSNIPSSVTALVVTTIALDASAAAKTPRTGNTKLLGIGLVTHNLDVEGNLQFLVRSRAATLLTGEAAILDWIERELAQPTFVTGYNLVSSVLALIDRADPALHPAIVELLQIDWRTHQLSLHASPVQQAPLSVACAAAGIRVIGENVARDQRDWLTGRSAKIEERLILQGAATWKLWAVLAAQRGVQDKRLALASAHLDAWLDAYLAHQQLPAFKL